MQSINVVARHCEYYTLDVFDMSTLAVFQRISLKYQYG